MKFNCGKIRSKLEKARNWHRHFAWWPVQVADYDCRWLEVVERRYPNAWIGHFSGYLWRERPEYRVIDRA